MTQLSRIGPVKGFVITLAICWAAGCTGGGPAQMRIDSVQSDRLFSKQFSQKYFSQTKSGEFEVVLVDDGTTTNRRKQDEPLEATEQAPLRQVVAIRVYWRPPTGTRADHPSATNAVVDWYVIADSADQTRDRLHYQGAAFVKIFPKGNSAKVIVRNGGLTLVESSGALNDPVGDSTISGSFIAKRNDTMVAAVTTPIRMESLARIRTAGAKQPPAARSAAGQ